jgi:hypothetical protein
MATTTLVMILAEMLFSLASVRNMPNVINMKPVTPTAMKLTMSEV